MNFDLKIPKIIDDEICVSGPSVMNGYWCDAKKTSESFVFYEDIFFYKTGDKGYLKDIELNKIADFESSLLSYMATEHKEFMDALAESGEYSDEIIKTFTDALDKFKSTQTW